MRRCKGSVGVALYQLGAAPPPPSTRLASCVCVQKIGSISGLQLQLRRATPAYPAHAHSLSMELKSSPGRLGVASDPVMWRGEPQAGTRRARGKRTALSPAPRVTPPPSVIPLSSPSSHSHTRAHMYNKDTRHSVSSRTSRSQGERS